MSEKKNLRTKFMHRCLELALKGYGQTSPNPLVGAIIVRKGRVIAEGYHKKAGAPHAELNALRKAGKRARGADLLVNLEPCCHYGRTPPCTDAIIKAGIKRLFYGMKDPNPAVSGTGLKLLKKAGIKVVGPILEKECQKINEPFIKWMKTGMPHVTAKIALTLDGRIADFKGDSKWITNELAREYVHSLRAGVDIVMVGAETFRKDRPSLNVRLKGYKGKQPLPVIVGLKGGKKVNLKKLLKELGSAGFQSILVEGGGKLHTELLKKNLIDRFVIFIAPKILGETGIPWIKDLGQLHIRKAYHLNLESISLFGDNIAIDGVAPFRVR